MLQRPLIEISDALVDRVVVRNDDAGFYKLVAGPHARIGVVYEVINNLVDEIVARMSIPVQVGSVCSAKAARSHRRIVFSEPTCPPHATTPTGSASIIEALLQSTMRSK